MYMALPETEHGSDLFNKVLGFIEARAIVGDGINRARELLRVEGEELVAEGKLNVVVVDIPRGSALLMKFLAPKDSDGMGIKKKGVNWHGLSIQFLADTNVTPGSVTEARESGKDVSSEAMIGVVNGQRVAFFSRERAVVSEEATSMPWGEGVVVVMPLFTVVPGESKDGRRPMAICTRFPKERIEVSVTNELQRPKGTVSPDEGVITRKKKVGSEMVVPKVGDVIIEVEAGGSSAVDVASVLKKETYVFIGNFDRDFEHVFMPALVRAGVIVEENLSKSTKFYKAQLKENYSSMLMKLVLCENDLKRDLEALKSAPKKDESKIKMVEQGVAAITRVKNNLSTFLNKR